jgi:hypothetical protein
LGSSGLRQRVALSGGVDSRAVSSLFLEAKRNDGVPCLFHSGRAERFKDDYAVACEIAKRYGIELNTRSGTAMVRSGQQSFDLWRETSMGNYFPVRLPSETEAENLVSYAGSGGETNRSVYPFGRLVGMRDAITEFVDDGDDGAALFRDIRHSVRTYCPKETTGVRFHHSEFRARMHASVKPNSRFQVTPLPSKYFIAAGNCLNKDQIKRGKVLYDIMSWGQPGISTIRYDRKFKMPDDDIVQDAPSLNVVPIVGRVFGEWSWNFDSTKGPTASELTADNLQKSMENVGEVFTPEELDQAKQTMQELLDGTILKPGRNRLVHAAQFLDAVSGVASIE